MFACFSILVFGQGGYFGSPDLPIETTIKKDRSLDEKVQVEVRGDRLVILLERSIEATFQLFSLSGTLVLEGELSNGGGKFDISGLPPGRYALVLYVNGIAVKTIKVDI